MKGLFHLSPDKAILYEFNYIIVKLSIEEKCFRLENFQKNR